MRPRYTSRYTPGYTGGPRARVQRHPGDERRSDLSRPDQRQHEKPCRGSDNAADLHAAGLYRPHRRDTDDGSGIRTDLQRRRGFSAGRERTTMEWLEHERHQFAIRGRCRGRARGGERAQTKTQVGIQSGGRHDGAGGTKRGGEPRVRRQRDGSRLFARSRHRLHSVGI